MTRQRARMVLLSVQGMALAKIAEMTFASADQVRHVIHNFNADGFEALYAKYKGGRPKTLTLPERREIKEIARLGQPSTESRSTRRSRNPWPGHGVGDSAGLRRTHGMSHTSDP